jgi:hypothetical protein
MLTAIKKTIIRASFLLNVLFVAGVALAAYGADIKLSYHLTAGNDAVAATEHQSDARTALSEIMADKDMNAVKTPAHKPKMAGK